ncbi:MAG: hypothetical protein UT48_C0001G0016 [Parcubacteria group bacterium GW2011_GWE2_39_37]|uniref:Peptidase S24/S26A/S26B/S26C domain-containing protein n=1 Tax=Candidatus Falkowbacteria bacterium GW2011_GWF2_39_8 TaxID=1618642 RepID=A0A0G0SES4_9BACT|nr:MAG: hypothetical protein UT48_C0001G0016 [Parcubacteria group bacterium GW2011_GWE2_39_37]KKR33215.1 MAG: hypothetical protein UT64_C0012G0007 [Candidatus Falkowbacteria bacterium GW2011_GWF2_39_8]
MHLLQQKLLQLAEKMDISKIGLRKLGSMIGEAHPQKVKHHLEQLIKTGYLLQDKKSLVIKTAKENTKKNSSFFSLPIVGSANCGPATIYADENVQGYLKVSPKMINRKNADGLFVIKAIGDSMNQAKQITGGPITSGDYVIIDSKKRQPQNGDYVLSIIEESANIKRFYFDRINKQVMLLSESSLDIPPIYIHANDFSNYLINGLVEKVIKQPSFSK